MNVQKPLENWKIQSKKGFLDLFILNCLSAKEFYGYDLVQLLKQNNETAIREGIIYPILTRMQADGYVLGELRSSSSGPPRKYYRITPAGIRALEEMNRHWAAMVAAFKDISQSKPGENSHEQ